MVNRDVSVVFQGNTLTCSHTMWTLQASLYALHSLQRQIVEYGCFLQAKRRTERASSIQHKALMILFENGGALRSLLAYPKTLTTSSALRLASRVNEPFLWTALNESYVKVWFALIFPFKCMSFLMGLFIAQMRLTH